MDSQALLISFFEKAANDARIGIAHIGLYTCLLQCYVRQDCRCPLVLFASKVKGLAKISSNATYYRLIGDLAAYGYIRYEPSFYKGYGSNIYL
jgi:hypothetical protein